MIQSSWRKKRDVQKGQNAWPAFALGLGLNVVVEFRMRGYVPDGDPECVTISPRTLARAIVAWDKGEEYLHKLAEF